MAYYRLKGTIIGCFISIHDTTAHCQLRSVGKSVGGCRVRFKASALVNFPMFSLAVHATIKGLLAPRTALQLSKPVPTTIALLVDKSAAHLRNLAMGINVQHPEITLVSTGIGFSMFKAAGIVPTGAVALTLSDNSK